MLALTVFPEMSFRVDVEFCSSDDLDLTVNMLPPVTLGRVLIFDVLGDGEGLLDFKD